MTPEGAAREYRRGTVLLAVYLAPILIQGAWVAAPLVLRGVGLAHPSDRFVLTWVTAWMLALCAGRHWITSPVMRAVEQRIGR